MIKKIKSFMPLTFFLLINAAHAIHLDYFGDNIKDGWKVIEYSKSIAPFYVEFSMNHVSPKLKNAIYNSYELSKGNGLEISFKPSIKKESVFSRKKNGIQSLAIIFSKKLVKYWAEVNDRKNDLIMLRLDQMEKDPEIFKHSIFKNSNGQISSSNAGNILSGNSFCMKIINNKLFIYFNGKNIRIVNIQEILGQGKIYVTMLSSLFRKLILNDFKSIIFSENPKNRLNIPPPENDPDKSLSKNFPKLRKLFNSNNYFNVWIIGEHNERVNFISDSFTIEPTEIYAEEQNQEIKLHSKFYKISKANIPIKIKLIWNKKLYTCQKMFQGCTNIISIDFSNIDINCTKMDFMFEGCSKLEEIQLKKIQTSNVEDMSSMFSGCINLKSLNLLSFDTSKVISMESMFSNCHSLKSIDLSNFKTPKLINIKSMFENCKQLKYVDIQNFSTEKCQDDDDVFKQCENLDEINLFNYKGKDIFVSISKHRNLRICINNFSQIWKKNNSLNNMQNICKKKTNIHKRILNENGKTVIVGLNATKDGTYNFLSKDFESPGIVYKNSSEISFSDINTIYLNEGYYNITIIFEEDFDGYCDYMFKDCPNIVSIDFSNFDFSKTDTLDYIFYGCSSLTSINFGNFKSSQVIQMNYMFYGCSSLKRIDLSSFNTSSLQYASCMFESCTSLTSLDLSSFYTPKLRDIVNIFYGCKNLIYIEMPNFFFPKGEINDGAFFGCNSLKYLNLYNYKEYDIFYDIPADTTINIKENSEVKNYNNLKNKKFSYCKKFQKYDINSTKCIYEGEYHNITITVVGNKGENVSIMFSEFNPLPDYVEIINQNINDTEVNSVTLPKDGSNTIILMWTKSFENCENMFQKCDSIISIDLSDFNNSLINNARTMFSSCISLEAINFTNFNTSKIKDMNGMFSNCYKLELIDLSIFDTSLVEDMSFMFADCISLKSIIVQSFLTSNVKNMSSMFSGCKKLSSLNLSSFNTPSLKNMNSMFDNCTSLNKIDMSNFETSNLGQIINLIFNNCNNIKYLNLLNYRNKNIFESIVNYTDLEICIKDYEQIEDTNNSLIRNKVPNICCEMDTYYSVEKKKCLLLINNITVVVNGAKNEEISILNKDFVPKPSFVYINNELSDLTSNYIIQLPESGEVKIEMNWGELIEQCNDMFLSCDSLLSIDLSDFNSSLINNTRGMFSGCTSLNSINFNNFDTSKVTDMEEMFKSCTSLKSLNLTQFNTSSVIKMNNYFSNCSSLEDLNLLNFETSSVQDMGHMFYGCSSLKNLNLSNFNTSSVISISKMFSECTALVSIDLSNFNTTNLNEFNQTFEGCNSLIYINLYDYIGKDIFRSILNYTLLTTCIKSYEQVDKGSNILLDNGVINKCAILTTLISTLPTSFMSIKTSIISYSTSIITPNIMSTLINTNLISSTVISSNNASMTPISSTILSTNLFSYTSISSNSQYIQSSVLNTIEISINSTLIRTNPVNENSITRTSIPSIIKESSTNSEIKITIPTSTFTQEKETSNIKITIPSNIQEKSTNPFIETTIKIPSTTYSSLINKEPETPTEIELIDTTNETIITEIPTETEANQTINVSVIGTNPKSFRTKKISKISFGIIVVIIISIILVLITIILVYYFLKKKDKVNYSYKDDFPLNYSEKNIIKKI